MDELSREIFGLKAMVSVLMGKIEALEDRIEILEGSEE